MLFRSFGYNLFNDSIYKKLNDGFYFEHSNGDLTLNFSAQLTDIILGFFNGETWGIDNIGVAVGQIETLADFETGSLGLFDSNGIDGGVAFIVQ